MVTVASYGAQLIDHNPFILGEKLRDLEFEITQLFGALNFLDVDESEQDQLERDLDSLKHVRELVYIASELYPY